MPKGRARKTSQTALERVKHPKVVGADVYVVRLANSNPCTPKGSRTPGVLSDPSTDGVSSSPGGPMLTGSLYDELIQKDAPAAVLPLVNIAPARRAVDSRPCYRCVSYMHSVGIKRVFWTNGEGKWECAKVRDLVDMLDGSNDSSSDISGLGVFVTKHEVLMLRRVLGR